MRAHRYCREVALSLLVAASAARCDDWAIESFTRDGTLVLGGSHTSGYYTVEWAPTLTNGEWYADWSQLQQIPATGGTVEVAVPMFYRAVWNSNLDFVVTEHIQSIGIGNGITASFSETLSHAPPHHSTRSRQRGPPMNGHRVEAFLWANKATRPEWTKHALKVTTRPRVTQHGGSTQKAVE